MFVLIWATLLCSVRGSSADTGTSCHSGFCISLSEGEITAEAGLCAVIQCSFTTAHGFDATTAIWYKCAEPKIRCRESDKIFNSKRNNQVQDNFMGRVSLLETDLDRGNCSIVINDLDKSDSGLYQFRIGGMINEKLEGFTFSPRANISVKALTQKPTVTVPPLTEGQQTTLTCTAPGLCPGSDPHITWTWRGAAENDSHITGNVTTTQRRSSSLTFTPSAKHRGTEVTCEVIFTGDETTRETVTLNVSWLPEILNSSGCTNQSGVLTCVCISRGSPLPTIRWPLLDKHTEYSVANTVSKQTINSTIVLSVKDHSSTAVQCVSSNEMGKVKENLIFRTSNKSFVQQNGGFSVILLAVAVVSLMVNIVLIVYFIFLRNSNKMKPNQEDRTYMSLRTRDISPDYDVIAQRVSVLP